MDRFLRYTVVPTIVLDEALSVCQVSYSYLRFAQTSEEKLLEQNIYHLLDANASFVDSASVRRALDTAIATRKVYILPVITPERGQFWDVRATPIVDGQKVLNIFLEWEETGKDPAVQHAASAKFNNDETYRILVETVKDYAIFMLDRRGCVATWNLGAQLLKGYRPEEIIGRHFSNFYSLQDRIADKPGKKLQAALRDGKFEDEGWRYRRDGSRFWANVVITPVYRGSTLLGFSKVTRDLTERKAVEARLIAAYEETAKLKSDFLANMSHELRTPMHGMLSAITLLSDTGLNAEQTELAQIIEESGAILLQVINDILDYSKLAAGGFSLSSDAINVAEVISSVVRGVQATSSPKTTLKAVLSEEIPKAAQGDTLRYRQIVQNMVSNAIKFTEQGSICIRANLQQLDESTYTILTEVIDTGIGVPPIAAESLFTPFTQFDNSATKRFKGTGLGLSICKSLAELMGGTVGFKPNPNQQGSIFWFTAKLYRLKQLPHAVKASAEQSEHPARVAATPDVYADLEQAAAGKRILLAEDNEINQKVMLRMLNNLGFDSVDVAVDGGEALSMAKNDGHKYDLILMDISMPVLDGASVAQEIRKAGLQTPVIAVTANALKGQAETYLAKGMNDYIPKPVDRKLMVNALLRWL